MPQTKYGYPSDFLQKIMQVESSGGTNLNHPMIQSGLQAGTRGIGRYALMPNTVKELINRRRLEDSMTPELQNLDQMNPEQMKMYIESRPELEDSLAENLASHVLRKQEGDEDKAAYSWKMGHNLSPDRITPQEMNNPQTAGGDYVQKFRRVKELLNQPQDQETSTTEENSGNE